LRGSNFGCEYGGVGMRKPFFPGLMCELIHERPNVELTGSTKRSFGESSDRRERG
jgi:hypothetical protein